MGQRRDAVTGSFERRRAEAHEAEITFLRACRREAAERCCARREQRVRVVRKLAREHRNFGLAVEYLAVLAVATPRMLARRRYAQNPGKRCAPPPYLGPPAPTPPRQRTPTTPRP